MTHQVAAAFRTRRSLPRRRGLRGGGLLRRGRRR
jgi:hypothetical protein